MKKKQSLLRKYKLEIFIIVIFITSPFLFSYVMTETNKAFEEQDMCAPNILEPFEGKNCIALDEYSSIENVKAEWSKSCELAFLDCSFVIEDETLYIGVKKGSKSKILKFENNTKLIKVI